ncbi:hypothetical protein BCR36DRAFT_343002 [Piromyces finnis]|uniref:CUE domain-containing protein n=1 Tax=Piromyces finnis TaxID=1754191 RepID=A0A1Y1VLK7_9FUNG|nr:hypothetical protein BCR36DRAFT_343002 [Piromyces finnis]|eukprot:ORX59173.1 hypothetical protein BCR36DRAFT_343002 [Piromyces finnis]
MTVSLEKSFVEVDNKKVPALDPTLIKKYSDISLDLYTPYHIAVTLLNNTPLDEQIKSREIYLNKQIGSIKQLLQMNFSTFWNFILNRKEKSNNDIYNSSLQVINFIENYCRGCIEWIQTVKINRQKEKNSQEENWEYIDMPDNICKLESELSQYIFSLVTRISFLEDNNKYNDSVSKENNSWSKQAYELNIKKYNIFSIPFLFDFINLYYESNTRVVREVLSQIINIHPSFNQDIKSSVQLTKKLSEMLTLQIKKLPILLMSADEQFQQLLSAVEEVVQIYSILLEIINNNAVQEVLFKDGSFIKSLILLYQVWCDVPNDSIKSNQGVNNVYMEIVKEFKETALHILFIHLKLNYFDKIMSNIKESSQLCSGLKDLLIEILDITSENSDDAMKKSVYMENSLYIVDFDVRYGLVDELKELINKNQNASFKDIVKNIDLLISQSENQDTRSSINSTHDTNAGFDDEYINRTVLISQVQELFPDLGDGFIDQCLNEFNNNPETVIAKLLDNDLPENIKNLSRTSKRKKINVSIPSEFSKPLPSQLEEMNDKINENPTIDEILKNRRNIFDNDEFDILRNGNVDMSKVILGKKNRGTFEKIFDDKSKVNKERIHSIVNHYDMYDDEYDDTWDGINEFNVNIDNNNDDKDKDAEGDEKTKKQERNDTGGSSDPGVIYKATLMKWLESNPDVFLRNNRKSKYRKQLIDETGMSNEQIEGWYSMYQRNKKKRDEAKNKSKNNNNSNNSKPSSPTESLSDNNKTKVENEKGTNGNANNNNHNRNRSNKSNNGSGNNNNKNQNNNNKNQDNKNRNNNSDNKNKNDDKKNTNEKEGKSNNNKNNNNNNNKNNNNRRNNNNRGNKAKGKDGDNNDSSEKSNKPQYSKKRSDADNHFRKAGRQRKLNFMMGGFE